MASRIGAACEVDTPGFLPYLLILFIGIIWGMTFSLARIAAETGAHPLGLAFWQAAGGGLVIFVICLMRRKLPAINRQNLKRFVVIALAGTAIPGTLFFYAAAHVPAGILAISIALIPMFTYAVAWMLGVDRYLFKRFCGILCGFSAILMLSIPDSSLPEPGMLLWLMLVIIAAVFYTVENLYIEICIPQGTDLFALLSGGLLVAAVLLVPVIFHQGAFVKLGFPFTRLEWAILSMSFASSIAYCAFLYLVKLSGAVFASMAGYVITLSGVFWGIVFFNESHSGWVWFALLFMLMGMALVTPRRAAITG